MKKQFLFIFTFCLSLSVAAQKSQETSYGVVIPQGFTYHLDVPFTPEGEWEGKMDLYLPPRTDKSTPVIINIFGGGWNHGNKEKQRGFSHFFKAGCAVANIEYRLVDVAPAPAAIEDVRSALIFLLKNAGTYNIDPRRIVFMGGSAGGHLALMGAYLEEDHRFDRDYEGIGEIRIAAVLDKYGIADMVDFSVGERPYRSAVRWIADRIDDRDFMASVSPISYVGPHTPPTFIVHGDADDIVPYQQSVWLHDALLKAGVETEFMTIEGGGHGKFGTETNGEINRAMVAFLRKIGVVE
ncbi:MAG: alpha/beta hydrolase [Bacteroides sp.]|nr:alpha/beta hydrolase [Bacteroides sp.]